MSMNVYIYAERDIMVVVNGKGTPDKQRIEFESWGIPTNDSINIAKSRDPIKAYKQWILNNIQDEIDDEDGSIYNYGKEHIESLNNWLKYAENNGYIVRVTYD